MDFVQAREKFMSLRKSTRMDIASVIEEVRPESYLSHFSHKQCIRLSWVTMIFLNLIW